MRAAILLLTVVLAAPLHADTVVIEADRDATMIQDPEGSRANGAGEALFCGRNNQPFPHSIRRALLRFDVHAALPDGAIIDAADLTLHALPGNAPPVRSHLHRVLADWGEGASASSGGGGAPSQPGDVTWIHTFHDEAFWVQPGGQFVARESAEMDLDDPRAYTWESTNHVIADVRLWAHAPSRNFGWILLCDEVTPQTAKVFASRESPDPELRPSLEIRYHVPGRSGRD